MLIFVVDLADLNRKVKALNKKGKLQESEYVFGLGMD